MSVILQTSLNQKAVPLDLFHAHLNRLKMPYTLNIKVVKLSLNNLEIVLSRSFPSFFYMISYFFFRTRFAVEANSNTFNCIFSFLSTHSN